MIKCNCGEMYTEKEFEKLELTGHNILWDYEYRRCKKCGEEITPIRLDYPLEGLFRR